MAQRATGTALGEAFLSIGVQLRKHDSSRPSPFSLLVSAFRLEGTAAELLRIVERATFGLGRMVPLSMGGVNRFDVKSCVCRSRRCFACRNTTAENLDMRAFSSEGVSRRSKEGPRPG